MISGMDEEGLKLLNTSERCLCPGESLTYECTVMGEPGGSTVWQGSVFNCTNHEISLFHSLYETTEGAYGECDDIVGQSVRNTTNSDNNSTTYYVSQLTVPISSGTEGRTIECLYDNGETYTSVERTKIHITISIVKNSLP